MTKSRSATCQWFPCSPPSVKEVEGRSSGVIWDLFLQEASEHLFQQKQGSKETSRKFGWAPNTTTMDNSQNTFWGWFLTKSICGSLKIETLNIFSKGHVRRYKFKLGGTDFTLISFLRYLSLHAWNETSSMAYMYTKEQMDYTGVGQQEKYKKKKKQRRKSKIKYFTGARRLSTSLYINQEGTNLLFFFIVYEIFAEYW